MSAWLLWLLALSIGASALTWGMHREFVRLDRERRYQLWLETSPALATVGRDLERMSRQIGVALLPAMQRMARALHDAQPSIEQFAKRFNKPDGKDA